jgi:hypothetical protein
MPVIIGRRELMARSAAAWPFAARGQQPEWMRRIGVLRGYAENDRKGQVFVAALRRGRQKLGASEGRAGNPGENFVVLPTLRHREDERQSQ